MRRLLLAALLTAVCVLAASCGQKQQAIQSVDVIKTAEQFVSLLAKGDFTGATKDFDATMKQAMPPEKLKEAWQSMTNQVGDFQKQISVRTAIEQGFDVAYVTCQFEKRVMNVKVVYNAKQQVRGLWFVETDSP